MTGQPAGVGGIDSGPGSRTTIVTQTQVRPEAANAFRRWEHRIAAAQSRAPGFQGYRFEPPIPGVQEDWVSILRFDEEANLQAWLASPERKKLLEEASAFTEEFHARIARTGFDQWFPGSASAGVARRRRLSGPRASPCPSDLRRFTTTQAALSVRFLPPLSLTDQPTRLEFSITGSS